MSAMPKASELSLAFEVSATGIPAITCNDVFCPCVGEVIMPTPAGTYLNMRQLDRAINRHITTVRANAEREIYA